MSSSVLMSKKEREPLFVLIHSMNKSEKRLFKLFAARPSGKSGSEVKFVMLFDIMEGMNQYDEEKAKKKLGGMSTHQFSNLKRHLYQQILRSLRLHNQQGYIDIRIREQVDFARLLYGKGLYLQSLKLLEKIRTTAENHHQDALLLEILEFQKYIEERHITRSRKSPGKVEKLLDDAHQMSLTVQRFSQITKLKIEIHGWYIQHGHIRTLEDKRRLESYFHKETPANLKMEELSPLERINMYQAYIWFHFILLEFSLCFSYALRCVHQFDQHPNLINEDKNAYMRAIHYILTALDRLGRLADIPRYIDKFEVFLANHEHEFEVLNHSTAFVYLYNAKLNYFFRTGNFKAAQELVPVVSKKIKGFGRYLDKHRVLVFYYKFAYLYVANNNADKALDYLNALIDLKARHLREDIQSYSRLLLLIAHYELGNYALLEYLTLSVQRHLSKLSELNKMQTETISLIIRLVQAEASDHQEIFRESYQILYEISQDNFEKRSFFYLDVLTWVRSKIEGRNMAEILQDDANNYSATR